MPKSHCIAPFMFAFMLAALIAPSTVDAAKRSRGETVVVAVPQGVYVIENPCALDGTGESIVLTSGSIVLTYDRRERLSSVRYQDVTGIGEVSGETYAVAYEESHHYQGHREQFASQMIVTGDGSRLTEQYSGWIPALNRTVSCT